MNWELISHYAVPPLVGAVIGYFTNMIAVKMLFFPHEEKRIFGWRVPFTPGAIPKGKARLAKSAGRIVQNELFTREDISGKLLTEEVEKPLIDRVMAILGQNINEIGSTLAGSRKKYDRLEKNFIELLETKITEAIHKMDIPGVVKDEGSRMIKEQAQGSRILRLLVSDSLVDTVMGSVGEKMEEFIDNVKILINTLGYKVLVPVPKATDDTIYLFCKGSGASAKGFVSAGGFTVLEGSTVSDHIVPSLETRGKTYGSIINSM